MASQRLIVAGISPATHRSYVAAHPDVPLSQTPGWGKGFTSHRCESLGWFDRGRLVGAGLVRHRGLPRIPFRSVAILDSGPHIDWAGRRRPELSLRDWLDPLVEHLHSRGVITARIDPAVIARSWIGLDSRLSSSRELVELRQEAPRPDPLATVARLRTAGWQRRGGSSAGFRADVDPTRAVTGRTAPPQASTTDMVAGLTIRPGTVDDLPAMQRALARRHRRVPFDSGGAAVARWEGLTSDNLGSARVVVAESAGEIVAGGFGAVVGSTAWDLSGPIPEPDAGHPVTVAVRHHLMRSVAAAGATRLVIPTVRTHVGGAVPAPAPGWPPARIVELVGAWQYPVRETLHGALAPVIDQLDL